MDESAKDLLQKFIRDTMDDWSDKEKKQSSIIFVANKPVCMRFYLAYNPLYIRGRIRYSACRNWSLSVELTEEDEYLASIHTLFDVMETDYCPRALIASIFTATIEACMTGKIFEEGLS